MNFRVVHPNSEKKGIGSGHLCQGFGSLMLNVRFDCGHDSCHYHLATYNEIVSEPFQGMAEVDNSLKVIIFAIFSSCAKDKEYV